MRNINIHDLTLAMVGPPALVICGIASIIGVFLTWVIVPLYDDLVLPIAGWRLITWARSLGETFPEPYLVLVGGGLMALCGALMLVAMIPAVAAYLGDGRLRWMRLAVGIGAVAGAAVTAVGVIWFIPHIFGLGQSGTLGTGFYLVLMAAVLGLVFSVSMSGSGWRKGITRMKTLYKKTKGDYNNAP
jgi:hypothetical protein